MNNLPLLSLVTFLPLVGVAYLLLVRPADAQAKWVALITALATFIVSLLVFRAFDASNPAFQLIERYQWLPGLGQGFGFVKGIDGVSLWFIVGAALLTPIGILCSWSAVTTRVREFMAALLVLEVTMIGLFSALDLISLFVFFEAVLLPMFFLIGIWGGKQRIYSSYKFFLYTMLGSVLMLVALLTIILKTGTTDFTQLMHMPSLPFGVQFWLFLAIFLSFAIKSPLWPFHTWLPFAHTEAPTAGSVILAGILLKMGGYGFIRFGLQLLPEASYYFAPLVFVLSLGAIIFTSLIALAQTDMKKLIAYSSVAHMGYVTLGLFSFNQQGFDGAMMQMLSHTIVSAALFLCIGVAYNRLHTRDINRYGGLAAITPHFAALFMFFTLASVGLPGTSGFVGEFLALAGIFAASKPIGVAAGLGVILSAAYMLVLYRALFFGTAAGADTKAMPDLNSLEKIYFAPLVILVLWMGVAPGFFQNIYRANQNDILARAHERLALSAPVPSLWPSVWPVYEKGQKP